MAKLIVHRYGKTDEFNENTVKEAAQLAVALSENSECFPFEIWENETLIWRHVDLSEETIDKLYKLAEIEDDD